MNLKDHYILAENMQCKAVDTCLYRPNPILSLTLFKNVTKLSHITLDTQYKYFIGRETTVVASSLLCTPKIKNKKRENVAVKYVYVSVEEGSQMCQFLNTRSL